MAIQQGIDLRPRFTKIPMEVLKKNDVPERTKKSSILSLPFVNDEPRASSH
jgi:hypothetical protein